MSHKGLKDEYTREQRNEDSGKEQDNRYARQHPQLPPPPTNRLVLRPTLLDPERSTRAPSYGQHPFLDPPPLHKRDRPNEQDARVYRGVWDTEEVEPDTDGGYEDEELGV